MKNYFSILSLLLLISCSGKNPIEKSLETEPDEYWCYYYSDSYFTYYKFKDNKLSYRYSTDEDGKLSTKPEDPYMPEEPQKWSVSEDSIMMWGNFFYDVVSYNDKAIVLSYKTKEKPYLNYLFLIKEKESDHKKYPSDYDEKRLYNPEKYKADK